MATDKPNKHPAWHPRRKGHKLPEGYKPAPHPAFNLERLKARKKAKETPATNPAPAPEAAPLHKVTAAAKIKAATKKEQSKE